MKLDILPSSLEGKKLLSVNEVAVLLGICRDKVYELILKPERDTRKPAIHSVKVGRLRKIPAPALARYIDRLMEAA